MSVARSSSDSNENRLCTSGFVDNVTFSHNVANGSESNRTRVFRRVRQVVPPGGGKLL